MIGQVHGWKIPRFHRQWLQMMSLALDGSALICWLYFHAIRFNNPLLVPREDVVSSIFMSLYVCFVGHNYPKSTF